jgi:hypothetical protein
MSNAKTNYGDLNALFRPAAHYASPDEVLRSATIGSGETDHLVILGLRHVRR